MGTRNACIHFLALFFGVGRWVVELLVSLSLWSRKVEEIEAVLTSYCEVGVGWVGGWLGG